MTPKEKYKKALASRPSNEELKYWATLDTRAAEVQRTAFDADLEERDERFKTWLAEYNAQKVCLSNGIDFMAWKAQFDENVRLMSRLDVATICINQILAFYEADDQAGIAALKYVNEYEPDVPNPEMEEQQAQAREWMSNMARADEIHRERLERVRWMPEPEAAKVWNERQYAK